ncbi:hypothetical protein GH714_020915 [Hevea brasiliensis]|uniref:Retroviral polymerase SH3-like domain-containing protein n=1 Tax=Hevea brasiliensis TaxID=3981 RepID=A0A6A6KSR5_HEVBR|nr:hypothetical protein GH714_020915 [Hevea brasiliensis]
MAAENFVQPAIPRFDGHYDHWSMLMENFLRSKEYWQVVSEGISELAPGTAVSEAQKTEIDVAKLKDLKAKNYLFQAIDRSILETILKKLDDKGEKSIFLGVSEQSKAYKLYNPNTKKILSSRDVVFDEEVFWEWNGKAATNEVSAMLDFEEKITENLPQQTVSSNSSEDAQHEVPATPEILPPLTASEEQSSEPASSHSHRVRRRPAWMSDYEKSMMEDFEMTDLGMMHYFLGIEVVQSPAGISISQKKYLLGILDRPNDWLQIVNKLPNLESLILSSCFSEDWIALTLSPINSSSSLATLDLSYNDLVIPSIQTWLSNISQNVIELDLSSNTLPGSNDLALFGNMISLQWLFLDNSTLVGGIPKSFGNMSQLRGLYLMRNNLKMQLPDLIQNLSGCAEKSLEALNLHGNEITGVHWLLPLVIILVAPHFDYVFFSNIGNSNYSEWRS